MPGPATSEQMELLLVRLEDHDRRNKQRTDQVYQRLEDHTALLARIDERTQQHEKRMNRVDRRAGVIGSGAGVLIVAAFEGLKRAFGPPS